MSTIFESSEFESHPTRTRPFRLHGYQCGNSSVSGPVVGAEALLIVVPSYIMNFDICLTHKLWECNLETKVNMAYRWVQNSSASVRVERDRFVGSTGLVPGTVY